MSRKSEGGHLFIGRLSKNARTRDIEEVFETYGRITRCEIKYGPEGIHNRKDAYTYGFIDFEDRRDAADALRYENGRNICGSKIILEWAKGNPRRDNERPPGGRDSNGRNDFGGRGDTRGRIGADECARCHRTGHWAKDCTEERRGGGGGGGRGGGGGGGGSRRRDASRSKSRSPSNDRRAQKSRSRSPRSRSRS